MKPVSIAVVVKRLNRKLAPLGSRVRKVSDKTALLEMSSRWWLMDTSTNFLLDKYVDVEDYAKEFAVLRPCEVLAD